MSVANKAVVRAYAEALSRGDWAKLADIFAPDATIQGVTGTAPIAAALAPGSVWHQLRDGLNMTLEIQELVAEDSWVAALYIERGRWTGAFMEMGEPTGRTYELVAMEWFEIREGHITRRWGARDAAAQASQLGFQPAAQK